MASESGRSGRPISQYFGESQPNIIDFNNIMDNLEDNYPTQEIQEACLDEIATNILP